MHRLHRALLGVGRVLVQTQPCLHRVAVGVVSDSKTLQPGDALAGALAVDIVFKNICEMRHTTRLVSAQIH